MDLWGDRYGNQCVLYHCQCLPFVAAHRQFLASSVALIQTEAVAVS